MNPRDDDRAQLLRALRYFRGEDVGWDEPDAARVLAAMVRGEAEAHLRKLYSDARADWIDDVVAEVSVAAVQGAFKGGSVGEAVRFVQTCARNAYVDLARAEHRNELRAESAAAQVGSDDLDSLRRLEARSAINLLERLLSRVRLSARPGRRRRLDAWLDHRLALAPDQGRASDREYADRSRGRKDLIEIAERLRPTLGEEEAVLLDKLIGSDAHERHVSDPRDPGRPEDEE